MASKKKGLSMEEKANRVEEWFARHPQPYLLKEITTLVPKATGVIPQSIEEALELLLSEDRITCDKLGISNLYWKFAPGQAAGQQGSAGGGNKKKQVSFESIAAAIKTPEELRGSIAELKNRLLEVTSATESREAILEQPDEIIATDDRTKQLRSEIAVTVDECSKFADRDPLVAQQMQQSTEIALEAANRWAENVALLEQFVLRRLSHLGITARQFREQFEIPEDL
ncbi:Hypothetical protein, putative [Bodo saltans]|uniref:Meiotic nuclear division protein 1 n=1 Tax=Bodo saltans TaxID=75058 RepID=A0A0S4JMQ4_BODSA|nr:Hypothetical protein, putative [Bodo saltans]|eukprot:CUG91431.1 Hypothetical protein, putative [Bodo saltans]